MKDSITIVTRKYKQFSFDEEEIIRKYISKNLTVYHIHGRLPHRTIAAIRTKMYAMGIASPPIIKFDSHYRRLPTPKEKKELFSLQGDKADRWKIALTLTMAKIIEIGGMKTYSILGKPVSVFDIMRKYNSFGFEDKFPI